MRNAVVYRQLQHFRVDHDKAHFVGRGFVKHGHNHAVHAHRFARPGHTRHQQVRHFGQIAHHRHARNVFAQGDGELGFGFGKHGGGQNFAQGHFLTAVVRQLDAHGVFARDGLDNTHRLQRHRTCQIFGQIHNLTTLHALRRLDFIARDDRAGSGGNHLHFNTELGQFAFDAFGRLLQFVGINRQRFAFRIAQQAERGFDIFARRRCFDRFALAVEQGRLNGNGRGDFQRHGFSVAAGGNVLVQWFGHDGFRFFHHAPRGFCIRQVFDVWRMAAGDFFPQPFQPAADVFQHIQPGNLRDKGKSQQYDDQHHQETAAVAEQMAEYAANQQTCQPARPGGQGIAELLLPQGIFQNRAAQKQHRQPRHSQFHTVRTTVGRTQRAETFPQPHQRGQHQPPHRQSEQVITDVGKIRAKQAAEIVDGLVGNHAARPCGVVHIETGQRDGEIDGYHQAEQPKGIAD